MKRQKILFNDHDNNYYAIYNMAYYCKDIEQCYQLTDKYFTMILNNYIKLD